MVASEKSLVIFLDVCGDTSWVWRVLESLPSRRANRDPSP